MFALRGSPGLVLQVPNELNNANLTQGTARISPNKLAHSDYLMWAIRSDVVQRDIRRRLKGSTFKEITLDELAKIQVPVPPLPEQRKIASILGTWDAAIGRVEQLIAALQRRKQGLMQRLLTGAVRFPEFVGTEWSKEKAGNLFQPFSQRNNGDEELLSVTQEQGVVPRSMLDARVVMPAGSTEGYKLVEPGDFIISLRSFQGGIEYSQYRGLVSPAYTVLKPKIAIVDDFYKHLFKSREFIARLGVAIIGIRDGKQINYADFAALRLANPSLAEQQRIAEVLDAADREIALQQQRLAQLQAQKKGLMQRLLTGQVRVKVDSVTPAA